MANATEVDGATVETEPMLVDDYLRVRQFTEKLIVPLSPEDCSVQSMPDTSPTRWHIAHTTWFFETFILSEMAGYEPFCTDFVYLFNSYYNSVGSQFPRPQRGMISRPGLADILAYRAEIDRRMVELLSDGKLAPAHESIVRTGLHHEQQHQELILTDIKHALACSPLLPAYQRRPFADATTSRPAWLEFSEGIYDVGHAGSGFAFDNESPRHRTLLHAFAIAPTAVTCGEYLEFIQDGGYRQPNLWLSLGWETVQSQGWSAPLYWQNRDEIWSVFTLAGLVPIENDWPVCHVSYFEADAFARWSGKRLPTEFEWEAAVCQQDGKHAAHDELRPQFIDRVLNDARAIHPTRGTMLGGVWEWTSSSYGAYPGYSPPAGAIGEYNGKFMCNQYVLRGGSVATSSDHIRPTYRNFFHPAARWQFSGLRLARCT